MTTPTIAPTKYAKDDGDFLITKVDRSGALRSEKNSVTVPASTASGTVIGLVPFNKGARFDYASTIHIADLDTSTNVTVDIGYVYDDNSTYTNDPNAFGSALTTAQDGGFVTFDETAGLSFVADADGWIAVTTGGGATTTEGAITFHVTLDYDS